MSRLPNFFLIGAAKSGTTSLAEHLRQHPEVFFPSTKEPNYFALAGRDLPLPGPGADRHRFLQIYLHSVTERTKYEALFEPAQADQVIGDASVRYLYFKEAAPRIKAECPDSRFVLVLRDPISRAFSHHSMMTQLQLEPLEFREALAAESSRIEQGWGWDWHYAALGNYVDQLNYWFEHFDSERFLVVFYPEFLANPQREYARICQHLRIDETFVPDRAQRGKPAYRPKNLALDRFVSQHNRWRSALRRTMPNSWFDTVLSKLRALNSATIAPIEPELKAELVERFKPSLTRLSDLLGTDAIARIQPKPRR